MGFSSSVVDVLYHGENPFEATTDVKHEKPLDQTLEHIWFLEPAHSGVLTKDGVENIAIHKYTPGETTHLDDALSPVWASLTNLLPMWLAPNMVTTLGFSFCLLAYIVTWYHTERVDILIASWVLFFNGCCATAYYTLDCMDGKQARRTGTSSPLGQLFDHGVDCLGNIASLSSVSAWLMVGGTPWYYAMQSSLQFSFFLAQWEEYYTHVLPHANGKWIGVTEVNYGIALVSMLNAFLDRERLWTSLVSDFMPDALVPYVPTAIAGLQVRCWAITNWAILCTLMVLLCFRRVLSHVQKPKIQASALSKLFCPFLLSVCPFILPPAVLYDSTRYISISVGLAFCLITTKLIFLSMAKMPYAVIQFEAIPVLLVCFWVRSDERLTMLGIKTLFQICCVWYLYRFSKWASVAIKQIRDRLDIYVFTIKDKSKKD